MESDFISRIPVDERQKTALLFAFYNTIFFTLIALCLIGLFAIYQVLYMFFMPILWAMLVGTVLFPFKRRLSEKLRGWLEGLREENTPLLIGVAILPIQMVRNVSNLVYDTILSSTGMYFMVGYICLKILLFEDIFLRLVSFCGKFYLAIDNCIGFMVQKYVCIMAIFYTTAFISWIILQEPDSVHKKFARTLSLPLWIFAIAYVSDFFGPFRVLIFALALVALSLVSAGVISASDLNDSVDTSDVDENKTENVEPGSESPSNRRPHSADEDARLDRALSGDAHLRIISALCLLLWTVHHDILLVFIVIPFFVAIFIRVGEVIGVFDCISHLADVCWRNVEESVTKVVNIVVSGSLRKFVKLLFTSDRMFVTGLAQRVDLAASIFVMAGLAVGLLFSVIFTAFQLHNETVHLVKLGGNVISSHPEWMNYAVNYTEGQLGEHDIDEYVEQAYQQGRKWLASNARSLADPKDEERADQLESQLVDNIYQMWMERNVELNATAKAIQARTTSPSEWMVQIMSTSNLQALKGEMAAVISENIETVLTIMHSVWTVILLNISLLKTTVVAVVSLVFAFGFELLNFFIEMIVFLTAVYYLLASSDHQWLPLRLINELAPAQLQSVRSTVSTTNIAEAFEDAISGVFVLSAKMSIFYGLYTYFVHSLFELYIVFLPSMLAAIFAAIPIMPPYIVAVFGFVEIFLVRGDFVTAIVFALTSLAPLFFADAAFYKEVKGSHPYVTGLAVIGGMYWLGLQGAIFGPIILCCVTALFNVYTEFAKSR